MIIILFSHSYPVKPCFALSDFEEDRLSSADAVPMTTLVMFATTSFTAPTMFVFGSAAGGASLVVFSSIGLAAVVSAKRP